MLATSEEYIVTKMNRLTLVGIVLIKDDIKKHIIKNKILKNYIEEITQIDVALKNDKIIGFIIYQIDSEKSDWNERSGHGFIREFYVNNQHRKQGVGTKLIQSAENNLKKMGAKNIYLTSSSEYYVEDFYYGKGYKNEQKTSPKNHNTYFSKEL